MNWFKKKALGVLGGGVIICHTELIARKIVDGEYTDVCRVVKDKVVTDAFVALIIDTLVAGDAGLANFKYHAWGTGVTAENKTQTALITEGAETRATGSLVDEGATYKSVGTLTCNATPKALREHGLFNQEAVGGTLMDRTLFDAINVVEGNQVEFTFTITFTSGG